MQDRARALFDFGVKQTGSGGDLAQFLGKIGVGVTDDFHGRSLGERAMKVKTGPKRKLQTSKIKIQRNFKHQAKKSRSLLALNVSPFGAWILKF
jgi:hypothetical protein